MLNVWSLNEVSILVLEWWIERRPSLNLRSAIGRSWSNSIYNRKTVEIQDTGESRVNMNERGEEHSLPKRAGQDELDGPFFAGPIRSGIEDEDSDLDDDCCHTS